MATWAAQLQSIQQLGARLSRLTSEQEISDAISNELESLIAFHNVRVYRLRPDGELMPVAMRGLVGEFRDETPDLLRTRIGVGITGWVAQHKLPQKLDDAAHDPRALTMPGTEADLEESMLLAPLLYEDQVLGVIVLSKLGLRQFSDDDLRLLVIYASLAAQAMANADTAARLRAQSGRLERQLVSQRALLAITESIHSGRSSPAASMRLPTWSRGSPARGAWGRGSWRMASPSWFLTSWPTPGCTSSRRPDRWREALSACRSGAPGAPPA